MAADLEAMSLDELRRRRDAVRDEEEALSYRRRVLHAQLDLVQAASTIADRDEFESLLAEILSDDPPARSGGEVRAVHVDADVVAEVEPLPDDLVELDEADRLALVERLRRDEQEISERRRALLDELDALQAEIVHRFRRDGVNARQLLGEAD